jgi:DNA polymerase-3 subunit delta'
MSFSSIKGQEKAIGMLKGYIQQARFEGGYLFSGPQGVGKKAVAKILAKIVKCSEGIPDSCDKCASCLKIENNQHPDIHVMEHEDSEIKIEFIRQLQREISLRPFEAKRKVFIIDNAHNLTAEASNALLKILEEPIGNSLIILISDKPQLLFKTIISRCKSLKFPPLSRGELEAVLKNDYGLDNNTAHFLAYFSEGRLGRALKLKDSDIIREKNIIIDNMALSSKPNFNSLNAPDKDQIRSYLNILATWFRDIYLIKIGMPHSEIINSDRKEDLLKIMAKFSFSDLNDILCSISDSIIYLTQNINNKLVLYNLGAQIWKT